MKECSIHPFNVVGELGCPRCHVEANPSKPRGRMPKRSNIDRLDKIERETMRDELEPHEVEQLTPAGHVRMHDLDGIRFSSL